MTFDRTSCIKESSWMPVSVTDVDNGSKNICHHSDDDWGGANCRNFVQRTLLSYALCQE